MNKGIALFAAGSLVAVAATAIASDSDVDWGEYQSGDMRSGYTYAAPETRAMQDDDFENPGYLWVESGEELWETAEGEAGKACSDCHGDAEESMAGVAATYPKVAPELGKLINVEQRINQCRTERMQADAWKWESDEMLAMTVFVNHQSRGMPVDVKIDGEAAPFFKAGEEFYTARRGQLDMACSHCHEDNAGIMIRANLLSQGQGNGFPTYRLKWQKVGSLHRRFRGCNTQVRATPFGYGSDEYTNLELYVKWRGRGLPVETPAVRN